MGINMNFMTSADAALLWNISQRRVQDYCKDGKIKGVVLLGNRWLIPKSAKKPDEQVGRPKKGQSSIKSKERVFDYAEVFTDEDTVEEMLSLVENQMCRVDSRFLEPACGTGNFLEPVLREKLSYVKKKYQKVLSEYEQQSLLALGSLYGIDILEDNVQDCRNRLFEIWQDTYAKVSKRNTSDDVEKSARFILEKNIVWGDALTMLTGLGEKIVFSEWSIVLQGRFQRRDFRYDKLQGEEKNDNEAYSTQMLKQYTCDYRRIWNDVN